MGFLLAFIYVLVLSPGVFCREEREKMLYSALFAIAIVAAFVAGNAAREDHIGATLSGMVSIFMR